MEYFVNALNKNGESAPSRLVHPDPSSWRNWDPRPGESFRRVTSFRVGSAEVPDSPASYYP